MFHKGQVPRAYQGNKGTTRMMWLITPWKINIWNPTMDGWNSDDFRISIGWFLGEPAVNFQRWNDCELWIPIQVQHLFWNLPSLQLYRTRAANRWQYFSWGCNCVSLKPENNGFWLNTSPSPVIHFKIPAMIHSFWTLQQKTHAVVPSPGIAFIFHSLCQFHVCQFHAANVIFLVKIQFMELSTTPLKQKIEESNLVGGFNPFEKY